MPFERPTLSQLITRGKADINTRLPGADANLRASPEEVMVIAASGLTSGLHGHLKWLSKQILTDLSDDEFLVREAADFGLTKSKAVAAIGPATFTGTNGVVIPLGTIFTRNDGTQFKVTTAATVALGQAVPILTAVQPALAGNCLAGVILTIASPITGLNATGVVSGGGIVNGSDIESTSHLRTRVLLRKQTPPTGGGPGDYKQWALAVSGVTRAWEFPLLLGPGTISLFFVRDGDVSIIPNPAAVAIVQAYLNTKAPVTAQVIASAPIADVTNFTIHIVPSNTTTQAAVTAELAALLLSSSRPSDGAGAGTILLSQINDAVGIAAGVTDYTVTLPAANVVPALGHMPILGTITWA